MTLLLNKIPTLDKGFVAKLDSSCNSEKLNQLAVSYFKRLNGKFLAHNLSTLTMVIKCPLFVQLNLSTFNLSITPVPHTADDPIEVYIPNVSEIGSSSLETSNTIISDMQNTSAALLMNPKAYQEDGCDKYISHILTPINTYTTIIVHGGYNNWCRFASQENTPTCIRAYTDAVNDILKAEWQ